MRMARYIRSAVILAAICLPFGCRANAIECFNKRGCYKTSLDRSGEILIDNNCGQDLIIVAFEVVGYSNFRQLGLTGFRAYSGRSRKNWPFAGGDHAVRIGLVTSLDYGTLGGDKAANYIAACGAR
jgi:hypothetical protein